MIPKLIPVTRLTNQLQLLIWEMILQPHHIKKDQLAFDYETSNEKLPNIRPQGSFSYQFHLSSQTTPPPTAATAFLFQNCIISDSETSCQVTPEKGTKQKKIVWDWTIFHGKQFSCSGGILRVKKRLASFVKRIYLLFRVTESPSHEM